MLERLKSLCSAGEGFAFEVLTRPRDSRSYLDEIMSLSHFTFVLTYSFLLSVGITLVSNYDCGR